MAEVDRLKAVGDDLEGLLMDSRKNRFDMHSRNSLINLDVDETLAGIQEADEAYTAGADVVQKRELDLSMPSVPRTFEGPKWKERLDATLKNYDTIASHLPFPTANPILMKQRQTLQKRADGYSYLQGKSPRSIRWTDNFTNADLIKAWKVQKNQFVGQAYGAANPQNVAQTNALAQALQLSSEDW